MEKLIKLISLCKASVNIEINSHKDNYETVESYIQNRIYLDEELLEEMEEGVYDEMIKRDTVVEIQVYPNTPIGSYKIYHYDVEKAIDLMIETIEL